MAKCAPKTPAKKVAVKDLATKKNPKGGVKITKPDLIKL
jgi:hypothetical protein